MRRIFYREDRSIPACAGEPRLRCSTRSAMSVYPRVCGGTEAQYPNGSLIQGLSPRVRGNRSAVSIGVFSIGSIPACAGEPGRERRPCHAGTVYPRVCGGTRPASLPPVTARGLSPRVRGNPVSPGRPRLRCRSIPACAGEPKASPAHGRSSGVYPRVCGGTRWRLPWLPPTMGLSPRVRGNLSDFQFAAVQSGSIPACAGEPGRRRYADFQVRVYPRVCGGTGGIGPGTLFAEGLSPRVRGNRMLFSAVIL